MLPESFAAARDDEVRKARVEGRQPLARELSRLRRPTQSAWLVNQLWRDQRDVMEEILQLAGDLSRAQARGSVEDLHRLTARRRDLEAALLRRAHTLAEKAGVNVTATMERDALETLAAALASTEVAEEVRSGRLVRPASYAGFGPPLSAVAFAPPLAEATEEESSPAPASRRPRKGGVEPRDARAARETSSAAEQPLREARALVDAAARELQERSRAADLASQHHQEMQGQVEQLRQQLRAIEKEAADAKQAALAAARRRSEAEQAHEAALRALERTEKRVRS